MKNSTISVVIFLLFSLAFFFFQRYNYSVSYIDSCQTHREVYYAVFFRFMMKRSVHGILLSDEIMKLLDEIVNPAVDI